MDSAKSSKTKKISLFILAELLVVGLFLLALGSPLNTKFANNLLLHPTKGQIVKEDLVEKYRQQYGTEFREVNFKSKNGMLLHAWHFDSSKAKNTILVCHGNAGNISFRYPMISVLLQSGASVFIFDYRGFGLSQGKSDDKTILEDGISAFDYLVKDLRLNPESITLYGESLGCAVASKILKKRPDVNAVILQSPFATLTGACKDKLIWTKIYPDSMFPQRHLENISAYKRKHAPLLLIHGENDMILSSRYSKEIFEEALEPKQLITVPNLGHNNLYIETDNASVIEKIKEILI